MGLDLFIKNNLDAIVSSWEHFARTLPAVQAVPQLALRDHSRDILLSIASGMQSAESPSTDAAAAATATEHGARRPMAGFDLAQLFAEFQALRTSVTAAWRRAGGADAAGSTALEELVRFNEGLDRAVARSVQRYAGEVAASRDMFLAVLGHDLRAPLAGIEMSAFLLSKPGLPDAPRQQAATRIKRAARDVGRLATDLLEYARARLGAGIQPAPSECDLGLLCEGSVDAMRALHPGQRFAHRLSGDLRIDVDAPRLRQVLSTLLNHAMAHGGPDSPVMLVAQGQADSVVLKVITGGPPIPVRALRSLFDPLGPAPRHPDGGEGTGQPPRAGPGLGLFIVRETVQAHGGTVEVESASGIGTVFTLRLPRSQPAP